MRVKIARTDAELDGAGRVLRQLRPAYDQESLIAQVKAQQDAGYQVACVEDEGKILCVAGFRFGLSLAWGKHIYVDDLVTDETHRSTGAGKVMIDWLKSHAADNGCRELHLDSGVQRYGAHRFYLREGFDITSHHFAITNPG